MEPHVARQGECQDMLPHAGALADGETEDAFQVEWPETLAHITGIKDDVEHDTFKALTNWGHPCIFEEGFTWDPKREGAYPCMYQIKIDGIKVYRVRVLWDAGNLVYSKFLDADMWYRITGCTFGEEKKGDLVEFLCFSGAIAPSIRPPWRMQASAMRKGCAAP